MQLIISSILMKIIFWNTKNVANFDIILSIIEQEQPDLFYLAEFSNSEIIKHKKSLETINYEYFINPICDKIITLKEKKLSNISLSIQHKDYSCIYYRNYDLHIIALHMPSQMSYNLDALKYNLSIFKSEFENHIGYSDDKNILLIGDFNVNPFESPIISFDGLGATNTINFNSRKTFRGSEQSIYYNPTWNLYSKKHFPGTFRKTRPSNTVFDIIDHHLLDQVIISQKLLKVIKNDNLDIIYKTSDFDIFDEAKLKINFSDHLPIKYEFEI